MKKEDRIKIFILLLLVGGIFLIPKLHHNKIELNKSGEVKAEKKQFAMYKQKNDKSGYDLMENATTFPEGYKLNLENSYCLDMNGNKVDNVLSYPNEKVTVTSNKTVFCTLYFDVFNSLTKVLASNSLAVEYRGDGYYHDENDRDTTNPFFTRPIYYWYANNDTDANNIRNSWNLVYAGSCWQIIRTTDQGGVKLLYNGEPEITEVDGETKYDCSDNRNLYHMGGIEEEFSISGSKLYGNGFTSSTNGTTTTFTLTDTETVNVTASNASSVVGKYTCGSTSSTCTFLRKIVSIKTGTTAIVYIPTERDNIGRSKFNTQPAYVGYMYNDNTEYKQSSLTISEYIFADRTSNVSTQEGIYAVTLGWYFSDTYLTGTNANSSCSYTSGTEGQNTCYALGGTPELGSNIVGTNNDYSKLVGKYTMMSNDSAYGTTNSITNIYYVAGYNGTTLYLLQVGQNHPLSYYQKTYNLSKTYENGSLQNSVQVKNFVTPEELAVDNTAWESTWVKVYNTYNNQKYYVCTDGTDTCAPYYIISTSWNQFTYYNTANTYNFSNAISYNTSTSKYTLDMSNSNAISFWDFTQSTNTNKIGKAHYVCLDNTSNHALLANETECTWVGYVYYISSGTLYYMPLSGGQYVSTDTNSTTGMTKWADNNNLLYKMLYASDVNNTSSTIKSNIDKWYEARIKNTTAESKIDTKEIYCGDRSTSNNFGSWNLNANNMTTELIFYGLGNKYVTINGKSIRQNNLSCPNKSDAYSKDGTGKGNGALTYAIGLMSYPEMENMKSNAVRKTSYADWLMSPDYFSYYHAYEGIVNAGYMSGHLVSNASSVRPAVSLIAGIEYSGGDGTFTNPYVVE